MPVGVPHWAASDANGAEGVTEAERRAQELGAAMLNAARPYIDVTLDPCAHLAQPYSTILVSPGFRLPFFGCQFPDKTETGNSNLFCKAVVVPTEPGDT